MEEIKHMKKYWFIVIIVSTILLTGCRQTVEGKELLDDLVMIDRGDTSTKELLKMKFRKNVYIDLEILAKISELNGTLFIETDDCFINLTDEYKDVVSPGDNVWITFDCALVSSYDNDTVTFTYDDIRMYKVISSEELLDIYGGEKCNTYYVSFIPKGMCSIDDYGFEPTTGYYVESMDFSFIDNSLFSYDYFKEEYLISTWYSPYEDDELLGTERIFEINQSNMGIGKYKEEFEDIDILY